MFSNKDTKTNNKYNLILLFVILFVLVCDAFFVSRKEGFHMDEILSYELSNSEFTPWITPTQPQGRLEKYYQSKIYDRNILVRMANLFDQAVDVISNRSSSEAASMTADVYDKPVWMSREEIVGYVTYDKKDSVLFLSPYYNSTTDNHPPLYFMLMGFLSMIHELISPGTLSAWTGCILNMVFMAFSLLLIAIIFRDILGKKNTGIFAALFYGLSAAGISTVLLIRMYSMAAFFCLAFTYVLLKKLKDGEDFKKGNRLLILVTVLGFLTQYFVCIYYFFLTAFVMLYLALKREKKKILYLFRALVISGIWGVCLYPFVFHDLFGTKVGESVMGSLTDASGYFSKLASFFRISSAEVIGSVTGMIVVLILALLSLCYSAKEKSVDIPVLFMGVSSVLYLLTVSRIAPYLVDRYLMPVFPVMSLCAVFIVQKVIIIISGKYIKSEKTRKRLYYGLFAALMLMCTALSFCHVPGYLYKGYTSQKKISERYRGLDAVVVYEGTSFYQNIPELMNYGNTLLLKEDELKEEYDRLSSDDELIVIIGPGVGKQVVYSGLGKPYGFSSMTVLLEDGVFGDTVCLLSK